jgi:hypothetical protein
LGLVFNREKSFYQVVKNGDQEAIEKDFFDKIAPRLSQINEGYYFLTGMSDDSTAELVLTADGEIRNVVFIEELIELLLSLIIGSLLL